MNNFEYVLTDDKTLECIIQYINIYPQAFEDKQNITLGYGVADKDRKVFITLVGYMSDCIKRCDDGYDDYSFVAVINKNTVYSVSLQARGNDVKYMTCFDLFKEYEELIKGAIEFHLNSTPYDFEDTIKKDTPDFKLRKYDKELVEKYLGTISD